MLLLTKNFTPGKTHFTLRHYAVTILVGALTLFALAQTNRFSLNRSSIIHPMNMTGSLVSANISLLSDKGVLAWITEQKKPDKTAYKKLVRSVDQFVSKKVTLFDRYVKKVKIDALKNRILSYSKLSYPKRIHVKLTSKFGMRKDPITKRPRFHRGVDISARTGSPIYAFDDGIVSTAKRRGQYGVMVEINHGHYSTRYAHNLKNVVKPGDHVKRGQLIAYVGRTGRTTGSHVHFEIINEDGIAANPMAYISTEFIVSSMVNFNSDDAETPN